MAINYLNNSKNLLLTQSNSNQFLQGEQLYTTPGTYNWIAPPEVTSVNVVCVGGGVDAVVLLVIMVGVEGD